MVNFVAKFLIRSVREKKRMKFGISFTNKEITPWGGMVFLQQMLATNWLWRTSYKLQ
jgi:hypothetical protein